MKQVSLLLLGLFLGLAAQAHPSHGGHLVFAGGSIHAHLSWLQGPDAEGAESKMRLEWHDGSTHDLIEPGLPFSVKLWMPSMGHGSAPTKIQKLLDGRGEAVLGTYQVSNMYFTMPGQWEVRITVKRDGREETKTWSVLLDGEDHGGHEH